MEKENRIYWVYGNKQTLLIPLEKEVMTPQEEIVTEPYYPVEGATVAVALIDRIRRRHLYTPVINGNLLTITDNGTLPIGCYGVEIIITNPDGTPERSMWEDQIIVTNDNVHTLKEWDEFKEQNIKARAAVFFFAKGNPFTYNDFTQEEIRELQKPAHDAATEMQSDYAIIKQDAQMATDAANNAASLANQKAGYAKEQGDYAKQKADEIEHAKGDYQSLGTRLDAMEANTDDRMERTTEAEFDEIFT